MTYGFPIGEEEQCNIVGNSLISLIRAKVKHFKDFFSSAYSDNKKKKKFKHVNANVCLWI